MTKGIVEVSADLYRYILDVSDREPEVLARLREETAGLRWSAMQISRDQGQFMGLIAGLMGAKSYLEIGTFTGYSALALALAVPDLRLTCCDISKEWTDIGRRHWEAAGVAERITLHLGPALETLETLRSIGERFALCFIDADKTNGVAYYEAAMALVRPGGLIALDNVLWGGSVIDEDDRSEDTLAIRALNRHVRQDSRVVISLVPIGDGLTLAVKR